MSTKYICSDPDCAQYYRKVNDFVYVFIEAREWPDDGYVVSHSVVDVRDYSLDEIWNYCSGYYSSLDEMISHYGIREALHIMAECVFEQLDFCDMEFNAKQENMGKAIKFIHQWIKEHGMEDFR